MEIAIIALTAFVLAILTFFSGFGLGTILTPVMMVFFPADVAIALTGVVHFFNNSFKLTLVGKHADKNTLIRFGIPAVLAAVGGSLLLLVLSELPVLFSYQWQGNTFNVYPVKFIVAILLIVFACFDLIPYLKDLKFDKRHLSLGGMLSGFFGGLSGNQGALRSAFLIRAGLSKEAFIATAVVVSFFVDLTRLGVYFTRFSEIGISENLTLLITTTGAAIIGAYLGNRLLKKVTLKAVQTLVAVMLIFVSIALGAGWL